MSHARGTARVKALCIGFFLGKVYKLSLKDGNLFPKFVNQRLGGLDPRRELQQTGVRPGVSGSSLRIFSQMPRVSPSTLRHPKRKSGSQNSISGLGMPLLPLILLFRLLNQTNLSLAH